MKKIRIYFLAVKYWAQGDSWKFAKKYAEYLVRGWK